MSVEGRKEKLPRKGAKNAKGKQGVLSGELTGDCESALSADAASTGLAAKALSLSNLKPHFGNKALFQKT